MLYKGRGDKTQHMGIAYADSVRAFLKNQWQTFPVIFAAIVVVVVFMFLIVILMILFYLGGVYVYIYMCVITCTEC